MAKSLQTWLKNQVMADIKESRWYRTAPAELRKAMKMRFVGVEKRRFGGLGTVADRECLVVECTIGDESQEYLVLVDQLAAQQAIN